MKRKLLATLLATTMVFTLAACGSGGDDSSSNGDANNSDASDASGDDADKDSASDDKEDSGSSSGKTIRLVNGKIEVDEQLKKLASMYEEETGVKVEIESMGGGIDIQGTLKGYYQADNMPDIFVNGGSTDFGNWEGMLDSDVEQI